MAADSIDARGVSHRGVGAPAPASLPELGSPPLAQPRYFSHVMGQRPVRNIQQVPGETWVSNVERGLSVRSPHFVVIPKVPSEGRGRPRRPGWIDGRAKRNIEDALENGPRITPLLSSLEQAMKAQGVNVPTSLLIGWMSQESSGKPYFVQPGELDEIGLFQISHAERVEYLGSTEPGGKNDVRTKMLDRLQNRGAKAQLAYAAKLIAVYQRVLGVAGLPGDAPSMPQAIRFAHNLGIHKAAKLIHAMATAKDPEPLDLATAQWDDVVEWAASHGKTAGFLAAMRASDYAILGGQQVLDALQASTQ